MPDQDCEDGSHRNRRVLRECFDPTDVEVLPLRAARREHARSRLFPARSRTARHPCAGGGASLRTSPIRAVRQRQFPRLDGGNGRWPVGMDAVPGTSIPHADAGSRTALRARVRRPRARIAEQAAPGAPPPQTAAAVASATEALPLRADWRSCPAASTESTDRWMRYSSRPRASASGCGGASVAPVTASSNTRCTRRRENAVLAANMPSSGSPTSTGVKRAERHLDAASSTSRLVSRAKMKRSRHLPRAWPRLAVRNRPRARRTSAMTTACLLGK